MAGIRKLTHDQENEVVARYKDGESVAVIGALYGISPSTVRSTVRKQGGTLRPVGRPRKS